MKCGASWRRSDDLIASIVDWMWPSDGPVSATQTIVLCSLHVVMFESEKNNIDYIRASQSILWTQQ